MRLGLVRYKYKLGGGAESVFALLSRELAKRGHSVHVITSQWQGAPPDYLELHQVNGGSRAPKWKRHWVFAEAVRQKAAELDLSTWLSLGRVPGAPVLRSSDGCHAAWLKLRSRHVSLTRRLSFKVNPLHRSILRLELEVMSHPDTRRVIAISRMVADELVQYCGLDPAKLRVIYNAVNQEAMALARREEVRSQARAELGLQDGEPVLLFLGSDYFRKGLGFAIQALTQTPHVVLLAAGHDSPARYQHLAQRQGVAKRVRFLGLRTDVPQLLAAADAFILPTIYDPLSIAIMEALSTGTPVITTTSAGASELIEPGKTGYVVERPEEPEQLGQAIRRALKLPKGFNSPTPTIEEWLSQTLAVIEESL